MSYFCQVSHHLTIFLGEDWERLASEQGRYSEDAHKGNFQWSKGSYVLPGFFVICSMYWFRWIISQSLQNRNCPGYRVGQRVTLENLFWLLEALCCVPPASTHMVPNWLRQPAAKSQEQRNE